MLFLAIFFPWVVLLINDDPVGAFIAMVMQVTVIGWIPASMWAWRNVKKSRQEKKASAIKQPPTSESRDVK